jgi:hypothetical protein
MTHPKRRSFRGDAAVVESIHHDSDPFCPDCGYNLRDLSSDRCPECGTPIDHAKLRQSNLPWTHRKAVGVYRAFWKTVNRVTLHPAQLGREMNCSPRFQDAVSFRQIVALHAAIPSGIAMSVTYLQFLNRSPGGGGLWLSSDIPGSLAQVAVLVVSWLCLVGFFFAAAGVASYFFHPRSLTVVQQNRAIVLSLYSCAPMVWLPLTLGLATGACWGAQALLDKGSSKLIVGAVVLLGFAPLVVQLFLMVRVPVVVLGATTCCSGSRKIALAIFLPVAWGLLGLLLLWAIPAAAIIVALMVLSLRS